jgi:hypothetical protein
VSTHNELMHRIERVMARNLHDYMTALLVDAPEIGAASIEVAGGVAAYSGAGSPLSTVKGTMPGLSYQDLQTIESFFREHGSRMVTIELAPWPHGDVPDLLRRCEYVPTDTEDIMVAHEASGEGPIHSVETLPADDWSRLMLAGDDGYDPAMRQLIAAAARLPNVHNFAVADGSRYVAGAQAVLYDGLAIFGNDETMPEARRRGAQTALIAARLAALPSGVVAVAEVAPGSTSERNYFRSGFTLAYTRQHYSRSLP